MGHAGHTAHTAHSAHAGSTAARIGAALWIAAVVQFLAAQVAVGTAWRTPYSWVRNNISDLGNVHCRTWDVSRPRYVCSPLHDLMNASFVAHGVLLLAGALLTGVCWGRGGPSVTARVLFVLDAAAWVLVGLVPADVDENLHVLGALVIMGVGNIGLLLTGLLRRSAPFGGLRPLTLVLAALACAAAVMFFGQYDPGVGMGTLERVAAFGVDAWVPAAGLAVFRGTARGAFRRSGARSAERNGVGRVGAGHSGVRRRGATEVRESGCRSIWSR